MIFLIHAYDRAQRTVRVEIVLRRETVEVRCAEKLRGVADREKLADWLRQSEGTLAYDDLVWTKTSAAVALTIDNVLAEFVLDPIVVRSLQAQLSSIPSVADELSITQRALLAFLAGLINAAPIRLNSGTYRALKARGLIEFGANDRWRATELGEKTAQGLLP